ncbi:MAG: A24 family peptidase [Acidimicrobiia bacterium]|jgi:leader peptidase (prepilin peptidase)/N-methyltransferase
MVSLALALVGLLVGVVAEGIATNRTLQSIRAEPARTPVVAAATAVLFALTPLVVGVDWVLPGYLWFVAVTVTLTLTDLDTKLIPNRILGPGTLVGLVLLLGGAIIENGPIVRPLAGGAVYFVLLLVLALIARGGFGFGDVKLAFLLGLFTAYQSWETLIVAMFAAFLLGGLVSAILVVFRIRSRKDSIPFGPYLVVGAYFAIVWAGTIASWYLGSTA